MRTAVLVLSLMFAESAIGGVVVTWSNPTANTDGSSIPASGAGSLTSTRVEYGTCSGSSFGTKSGEVPVPAPATSVDLGTLAPGTWCFRAFAKNTYGNESAASNVAAKTINSPVPNPPTILTIATMVHDVTGNRQIGKYVGSVPIGTACVGSPIRTTRDGTTWYEVPLDVVTLTKMPRSAIVVAKCA